MTMKSFKDLLIANTHILGYTEYKPRHESWNLKPDPGSIKLKIINPNKP